MPTARPDGTARSAALASLTLATGLRFTCSITSPGCSTRAAGLSGSTSVMIAPRVFAGQLELPRHLRRHVIERDAESRARVAARLAGIRLTVRFGVEARVPRLGR